MVCFYLVIIAKVWHWCKALLARVPTHLLVTVAVILAVSASFALGIIAGSERGKTPGIAISQLATSTSPLPLSTASESPPAIPGGGEVVASKSGTKYYFPWCGTVKRIKEENKVWFASREAAEAAGYEPAANCKGM